MRFLNAALRLENPSLRLAHPDPTARLRFRTWSGDDLDLALALWGDPEVTAFIGGPFDATWVAARLQREIAFQAADGVQYWPIFLLADGDFVGCCGLKPKRPAEALYELGFQLRPPHWGRGYGEESARAAIDFAFSALGASALFAGHHPANEPSRRLLQKLGFRYTHDEHYPPTGLEHPSYLLTPPAPSPATASG